MVLAYRKNSLACDDQKQQEATVATVKRHGAKYYHFSDNDNTNISLFVKECDNKTKVLS
ncbi:hypothetical protein RUM43_007218 [Polyplax serrata]|uniref:Uncharacterized protein n=1 Tax=Polyplax serrata TaxID=468196 RepID=A0AAN8PLY9_POLSC